jgi:type II secretory pathway component PulF
MQSQADIAVLLNLLGPLLLGAAIGWSLRGVRARQDGGQGEPLLKVLELLGWLLFVSSALLLVVGLGGAVFLIAFVIFYVVALVVARRIAESERRGLSLAMAISAERGIPLDQALRAFSRDRPAPPDPRLLTLADKLDAGLPLDTAMRQSRLVFPTEVLLAVRLRGLAGDLGPVLRDAMRRATQVEALTSNMLEKLFYVSMLLVFATQLALFWWLKIGPSMKELYAELDEGLPAVTQGFMWGLDSIADLGPVAMLVEVVLFAVLLGCLLAYLRWARFEIPVLRRLWSSLDSSTVLHCLAIATRHGQEIPSALGVLSQQHPKSRIRKRLARAAASVQNGVHWCRALRKTGFLRAREAAVLDAAERVGNLSWALNETSERLLQRVLFRFDRLLRIAFPLAVILIGGLVFFSAAAQFLPVVQLIKSVR